MVDVNELLTIIKNDLELYTGERRKTIQLIYTTLSTLSVSTIELLELETLLNDSTEKIDTKKDAIKMVRALNNRLTISKEEHLANELYLKEIRNNRKPLSDVIKTRRNQPPTY